MKKTTIMITRVLKRKAKKCMPLVFLVLICCFVKFLKQLPLDNGNPGYKDRIKHTDVEESQKQVVYGIPTAVPSLSKWIVVEIADSSACYALAARFHGWDILLLGVKDKHAKHSKCHFFNDEDFKQMCLKYNLGLCYFVNTTRVKWMITGLYLLEMSAQVVYLAFGDTVSGIYKPIYIDNINNNLVYSSNNDNKILLLDQHFGCNFSMNMDRTQALRRYSLCSGSSPVIRVHPILLALDNCDNGAPAVVADSEQYVLFSMSGSLIYQEAIWTLGILQPVSNHMNITSDEILALTAFIQKALWLSNNRLKIEYSSSVNVSNNNFVLSKFVRIINNLEKWTCLKSTFKECLVDLANYVIQKFKILHTFPNALLQWLKSLELIGYTFPTLAPSHLKTLDKYRHHFPTAISALNYTCKELTYYPVDYSKPIPKSKTWRKVHFPISNLNYLNMLYNQTCYNHENVSIQRIPNQNILPNVSNPWTQFGDMLLVVVFNNPHYEALPYVELIYAPFFPHILFCGPEFPNKEEFPHLFTEDGEFNRTFISYTGTPQGHFKGAFNYECMTRAMQMQYNVAGYLTIADDILLWVHNLLKFPKSSVWFLPENEVRVGDLQTLRECKLGMCDFFPHWNWWEDYKFATMDLLHYMKAEQTNDLLIHKCYNALLKLNGAEFRANGAFSDVYYVPVRLADNFINLSELFLKYKVFLEIAIPTILRCLEPPENVHSIKGTVSWDPEKRDEPWQYFRPDYVMGRTFFHPCKWGFITRRNTKKIYQQFLCHKILPFMFDPYERF